MVGKYRIVDGHAHTFSSCEVAARIIEAFNGIYNIEFANTGTGDIEDVLKKMDSTGIDFTIMANFAPPKIIHNNNLWSINVSKEHKNLVPLVSFHPDTDYSLGDALEEYMSKGAKGVKIHPMAQGFDVSHSRMDEVYSLCNATAFPIEFHCGRVSNARINEYADLNELIPVIDRYPEIPIILTHMADGNVDDVLRLAKEYQNVYFDTSIVITGYPSIMKVNEPSWLNDSMVVDIINTIGADRVLFGSDYPWGSPGHDLNRILKLDLSDSQKELILGQNAIRLFKI